MHICTLRYQWIVAPRMSDDAQAVPSTLPESTDVRYRVRSLLVLMAVAAVIATALGGFVGLFPAEAQRRLWIYWGLLLLLAVGTVVVHAWLRHRAEKNAGSVLFQLVPHSYFLPRAPQVASILFGAFFITGVLILWVAGSLIVAWPGKSDWSTPLAWIFSALFSTGSGISYLWWHRNIRLGEYGMVIVHEFVRWCVVLG